MQSVVYRSHAQELLPANSDVNKEETVLPANQNVNKLPPIPTKNISYKRPIPLDGSVRINAIIKLTLTSHVWSQFRGKNKIHMVRCDITFTHLKKQKTKCVVVQKSVVFIRTGFNHWA